MLIHYTIYITHYVIHIYIKNIAIYIIKMLYIICHAPLNIYVLLDRSLCISCKMSLINEKFQKNHICLKYFYTIFLLCE